MTAPKCPVCRGRLDRDGTCPFVSSHENILRMRAERGNKQSERLRASGGNTSLKRLREMAEKGGAARRAAPKASAPKPPKNPRRVEAGKKNAAAQPRRKSGKFGRKKKK